MVKNFKHHCAEIVQCLCCGLFLCPEQRGRGRGRGVDKKEEVHVNYAFCCSKYYFFFLLS